MVRKTSVKKETGKLYEENKMRRQMLDVVVKESNPNRVDVNKADT